MPASLVQTVRAFAYNNAWANHRLLAACGTLGQQDFEAERPGFFPSLKDTLNHIYVVDLFYVDALEGGTLGPKAWADQAPCARVADLATARAAIDNRLVAHCNGLTPGRLDDVVRVQAHAMLSDAGIKPPQLDEFFSAGEAPLRAEEFATPGLNRSDGLGNLSALARQTP